MTSFTKAKEGSGALKKRYLNSMNKLKKFGASLILLNISFCFLNAIIDAVNQGTYIFMSSYFQAGALLFIVYQLTIEQAKVKE